MHPIAQDTFITSDVTNNDLWVSVLENLKEEYGLATFNSWFSQLSFQEIKDNILKITAPSKFIRECIINNYLKKIKQLVGEKDPNIKIIDLRVKPNRSTSSIIKEKKIELVSENFRPLIKTEFYQSSSLHSNLDPRFTFDNFVIGNSNKLAFAAASAISEGRRNSSSNVLYIHSEVGMGKTHLLQAISQFTLSNNLQKSITYLSAEKFMHQYILSLKNNTCLGFREHLRSQDLFVIDDIQFICGKNSTQQEFANTFNALVETGKTVVISSDRSPYQLELDTRTKSRLAGGLVIEMKPADYNLRLDILKNKARSINLEICKEVLEFIAYSITSSIRELEGALNNLAHHAYNSGMEVTIKNVKDILKDSILAHEINITIDKIIDIVSNYYGIISKELLSKSRESKYVLPRQVTAFIAKQLTDKSLKDIGTALGKRDHATVIYSIRKLEERMQADHSISEDITKIIDIIGTQ